VILVRVVEHYTMLWYQIWVWNNRQYFYILTAFQVLLCRIYEISQSYFDIEKHACDLLSLILHDIYFWHWKACLWPIFNLTWHLLLTMESMLVTSYL